MGNETSLGRIGFGGAPLGGLYRAMPDPDAVRLLDCAYESGLRYFDTAPLYGFGLSEKRIGEFVATKPDCSLSTKAGRLLVPETRPASGLREGYDSPMPFSVRFDYSYSGVMRSFEDSLARLGANRVDTLLLHDLGRVTHGTHHAARFDEAMRGGGFRALRELRDQGRIRRFGLGVNEAEVCLDVIERVDIDVILLAGRYSLIEQDVIGDLFVDCERRGVSVVVGGVYNSGILATGTRTSAPLYFNYAPAPDPIMRRVKAIESVCDHHGVPIRAAALQFVLAHPVVERVVLGFSRTSHIDEALQDAARMIPNDLWAELKNESLIHEDCPVPVGSSP